MLQKLGMQTRSYYGMQLAHIGVAVFILGVTIVTGYQSEQDVRMGVGETVNSGGYTFRFNGVTRVAGPNYQAARADIEVSRNGAVVNRMFPEKRSYTASGSVMTETAIDSGVFRDLYISLGEPASGDAWSDACLLQTTGLLDLGWGCADGVGRWPGAQRPPLCFGGTETTRRAGGWKDDRDARHRAGGDGKSRSVELKFPTRS